MSRHILTLSDPALALLLRGLSADLRRTAFCPLGESRQPGRIEWLAHTVSWQPAAELPPTLRVVASTRRGQLAQRLRDTLADRVAGAGAVLAVGLGAAAGSL